MSGYTGSYAETYANKKKSPSTPSATDDGDKDGNVNTGAAMLFVPVISAAIGIVVSEKRK